MEIGVIMFTDIKTSSKLWNTFPNKMFDALKIHDQLIQGMIENHNGMVIKAIGDSFMAFFPNLKDSVQTALNIQTYLNKNPIFVGNIEMKIRIGLAQGKLFKKLMTIQNCNVVDFFGNTVNTSARLESNVSEIGGFAIHFDNGSGNQNMPKVIKNLIVQNKNFKIKKIQFKNSCKVNRFINEECRLISNLKGLNPITVFSIVKK